MRTAIKLQPVRMDYNGYQLNLIDTPGHVDFSYEVSRSLEACEGAILVVDATQGMQAQTLANVYLAIAADLTIIPVLNKIDLPASDVERVGAEIVSLLGCKFEDILQISAKTGQGVDALLEKLVKEVPPPKGGSQDQTRALIFDSYYDDYRGVILYVRLVDGELSKNSAIKMVATKAEGIALELRAVVDGESSRGGQRQRALSARPGRFRCSGQGGRHRPERSRRLVRSPAACRRRPEGAGIRPPRWARSRRRVSRPRSISTKTGCAPIP